tara:strand:+ start:351 stop:782 length:432 start_codon:yes stop_codon:yes gene_type:complete
MNKLITETDLQNLFNKPYGIDPPTRKQWSKFYNENVIFIDPTQQTKGLESYINAQEKLIRRCDDIFLKTHQVILNSDTGFIEWTMGLKILGKEFIYQGVTRLMFSENGLIKEHRDYFDFCGPTFGPVPVLGPFIRWLYSRFVS